jgi:anti-sigma regulatory factor (Ser/Thr protein kinase)
MVEPGEGTPATVVLRLPASPAHVRTARLVAAAMARRSGVDEGLLDEVRLAVGEACARAVRQHERYGVQEPVTVEFVDRGKFAVAVIDRAPVGPAGGASTGAAQLEDLVSTPLGPAVGAFAPALGAHSAQPGLPASNGLNATADSLGLALLDAVVQDLAVTRAEAGTGTRVSMSWPLEG